MSSVIILLCKNGICLGVSAFRMDQDHSLNISYDEWRDFLLMAPSTDLHDLIKFWRHSTVSLVHSYSYSILLGVAILLL